jgi:hypothetical protein
MKINVIAGEVIIGYIVKEQQRPSPLLVWKGIFGACQFADMSSGA